MINNKMLKEPLFLDFNSSGVLNRAEQAEREKCKVSTTTNLEDYRLLNKDCLTSVEFDKEREGEATSKDESSTTGSPSMDNVSSNTRFTNCMRNLRFNFSCLIGCIDE